jgi:hypothetical protein
METMMLPEATDISRVAGFLTSGGFLILAGSVVMVFLTQLIKLTLVQIKSEEVSGDWKKVLSAIALLLVTLAVGYAKDLSINADSNQYLSIFGMIGYVSSMFYRFGLRWIFEKVDLTTAKVLEIKAERQEERQAELAALIG